MDVSEGREEDAEMSEMREPETAASPVDTAPDQQTPEAAPTDRVATLEAELEKERAAAIDYMQRWQRAQADLSNFRRRTEQERDQQQKLYRAQGLAILLPALDTLERAFATLPATLRGYSWIDGIALVQIQLEGTLRNAGVEPIEVEVGAEFDPRRHEAIGEIESTEVPTGRIAAVIQRGYALGDLLLRPTLVQLSRGAEAKEEATKADEVAGGPGP
ncbi:MAG TPA: nucleotide exchange factor GrpE [Ktedonobacterales bacterium]|jgi:molecular chaperone GrpE|nr:nucleotide exchange factor GrpE [Ktedonobacterales bacterium]